MCLKKYFVKDFLWKLGIWRYPLIGVGVPILGEKIIEY